MTAAERFANAHSDIIVTGGVLELPRTGWIIGGLFAAAGVAAGTIGSPAGMFAGGILGFGLGYYGYSVVGHYATGRGNKRNISEQDVRQKFMAHRADHSGPMSLQALVALRHSFMRAER